VHLPRHHGMEEVGPQNLGQIWAQRPPLANTERRLRSVRLPRPGSLGRTGTSPPIWGSRDGREGQTTQTTAAMTIATGTADGLIQDHLRVHIGYTGDSSATNDRHRCSTIMSPSGNHIMAHSG
jgi:hypothetical protein